MATLNSTYQYIGRSNAVSCPSGWNYYILLYAKTSGDIATGKHSVSIKMRMACNVESSFYGWSTTAYAKANGVTAFSWSKQQVPNSSWNKSSLTEGGYTYKAWIDLKEGTAVVDAGFGVAKQITIEGSWVMNDTYSKGWFPYTGKYATASIQVTLPMLASASTITQTAPATLGSYCSVSWVPQAASFRYKLKFSIGNWVGWSDVIHPNKTSSYNYDDYFFPLDIANQIKQKTGTMTATLYTYSDSGATSQIGLADSETFTVRVPVSNATKPTISMSLSPKNYLPAPFNSLYLQGLSKVQATLNWSLKYDADEKESNITVDGTVYGHPYESGYLTKTGTLSVKGYVKDSRDLTASAYEDITVIPYSKPVLQAASGESNIVAVRCDQDGNPSNTGTYLKIKAKIGYEKVIANGVQNNFGKIQYRYRAAGGYWPEWNTILDTKTSASDEIITEALLNGALSIKTNYQVQVRAIDDIYELEPITLSIPSDSVYMDRPAGGRSMGLGGYSTGAGILDVYWKTKARGGLSLFNKEDEEISANDILLFPHGPLDSEWNPDELENGVYTVEYYEYPLVDFAGNILMEVGVLVQISATADGFVQLQMAFPIDSNPPVYRLKWYDNWSDWTTFKI